MLHETVYTKLGVVLRGDGCEGVSVLTHPELGRPGTAFVDPDIVPDH